MTSFIIGIVLGPILVFVLIVLITRRFGPNKREVDRAILKLFRRD